MCWLHLDALQDVERYQHSSEAQDSQQGAGVSLVLNEILKGDIMVLLLCGSL